jgi:hypothetical protein
MSTAFCTESPSGFHHFKGDACRHCGNARHDLRNRRNAAAVAGIAECRQILAAGEEREKLARRMTHGAMIGVRA